ncbi:hypothetical protein JL720_6217 [Aureococcus anophagefferens]|nr:hypothetical protein JL720_6217 [Aureococcus anophagefferens]
MSASLGSKLSDNLSEGLNRATEVLTFDEAYDARVLRRRRRLALLHGHVRPGTLVLFVANRFVDLYFLADMVVVFNTAVFDPKLNKWVLDRRKIAKYYFRGWFALDVLSILPYDVLNAKSLSPLRLLRTLKVLRLLKLLRVARVGRVLRTWAPRLHMSFKTIAVLRASLLIVVVHWLSVQLPHGAHALLLAAVVVADVPRGLHDHRQGPGRHRGYFSALHWAMRAHGRRGRPFWGDDRGGRGLLGTIVRLMIGEVAAILGNSDPASIEYKNTVDTLNAFAAERKFPAEMQRKLREFFVSASSMFRNVYYRKMLLSLSPGLQQTIAKEEIGRYITRIPFFRYSICRTLNIKRGAQCNVLPDRNKKVVLVPKQEGEGAGERRSQRASLVNQTWRRCANRNNDGSRTGHVVQSGYDCMSFDVEYDDDFLPDFESGMMVRELSLHMQCTSFMSHETIVHQGISWNDILYIMVEGVAVVFDQHDQSIASKEVISPKANNVIGKDVCTLLVDGKKRIRDYMARTMTHCLVYSMSADEFTYLLDSAHYQILRRGVRAYGHWMVMRDRGPEDGPKTEDARLFDLIAENYRDFFSLAQSSTRPPSAEAEKTAADAAIADWRRGAGAADRSLHGVDLVCHGVWAPVCAALGGLDGVFDLGNAATAHRTYAASAKFADDLAALAASGDRALARRVRRRLKAHPATATLEERWNLPVYGIGPRRPVRDLDDALAATYVLVDGPRRGRRRCRTASRARSASSRGPVKGVPATYHLTGKLPPGAPSRYVSDALAPGAAFAGDWGGHPRRALPRRRAAADAAIAAVLAPN